MYSSELPSVLFLIMSCPSAIVPPASPSITLLVPLRFLLFFASSLFLPVSLKSTGLCYFFPVLIGVFVVICDLSWFDKFPKIHLKLCKLFKLFRIQILLNLISELIACKPLIQVHFAKRNEFLNLRFEPFNSSQCFPPVACRIQSNFVEEVRILEVQNDADSCYERSLLGNLFAFVHWQEVEADVQAIRLLIHQMAFEIFIKFIKRTF